MTSIQLANCSMFVPLPAPSTICGNVSNSSNNVKKSRFLYSKYRYNVKRGHSVSSALYFLPSDAVLLFIPE